LLVRTIGTPGSQLYRGNAANARHPALPEANATFAAGTLSQCVEGARGQCRPGQCVSVPDCQHKRAEGGRNLVELAIPRYNLLRVPYVIGLGRTVVVARGEQFQGDVIIIVYSIQ